MRSRFPMGQPPAQGPGSPAATSWVSAVAEGVGRYVSATSDPLARLAEAQTRLQNAVARGLPEDRIRELQADLAVAQYRAQESVASQRAYDNAQTLAQVFGVAVVGLVLATTGAVVYRAVRN